VPSKSGDAGVVSVVVVSGAVVSVGAGVVVAGVVVAGSGASVPTLSVTVGAFANGSVGDFAFAGAGATCMC
jgi:hypothetical protein